MDIYEMAHSVEKKEDFIVFVKELVKKLEENSTNWENNTLKSYLNGIESWTEDMEGYYENMKIPIPTDVNWGFIANLLMAATMYE